MLVDYWVSFATSLDPVSYSSVVGRTLVKVARSFWPQYTSENEVCYAFIKAGSDMIPDTPAITWRQHDRHPG